MDRRNPAPPLSGLKIVDLTHVLAGPFATYQLALMGAEVTRIERLGGDDFVRSHGGTEEMRAAGLGASFLSQNAGKRSIALDLKSEAGREVFFRLVEDADVLCENFRPGVTERLGIGYDTVSGINRSLLYCSLSGYGPDGPLSGAPAYDHILQGISGMMAMTGTPESGPMRVGFPIVDYVAGQAMVSAIMAGLIGRMQGRSGGQHIQLSMLDAILSLMGPYAVNHSTTGNLRGLEGNGAFSDSPFSGRFDCAEGQIVVTANSPAQAARMAEALGAPGLEREAAEVITRTLQEALAEADADAWEARLTEANVPAAKVRSLAEILEHPQMTASSLMRPLDVPELGMQVQVPTLPFRQDAWEAPPLAPVPTQGGDTQEILQSLGYAPEDIAALREEGAVG
jgi:crotonobetainyl-CoA:carnitine CoA-transferase CaiB-like acyl-CoA transferase